MPLPPFPSSPAGRRPLSRYLKDFKHAQCYCLHCGRPLDRISLVLDGTLLNRARQAQMERLIDAVGWAALQQGLLALCRFCSDVYCHTQCRRFDIMGFKQYLCEQTDMRHSSIREYVVRLRRLDELLTRHAPPSTATALSELSDRWLSALPLGSQNNYRIALRKYQQFLQHGQAI